MNYLDIIIVIPLIYGLIKGFENGLIKEVTGLIGIFLGLYFATHFSSYLHPKVIVFFGKYDQFTPIISFTILFIVSFISIKILGYMIDKFTKVLALGLLSRILGAIFGGLKIIVILSFLILITMKHNLIDKEIKQESRLIQPLELVSKIIVPEVNKHKQRILKKTKEKTEKVKETLELKNHSE